MSNIVKYLVITYIAFMFAATQAAADNWTGNWNSDFGQLRLIQKGDRLFGDYRERGVIEGRISPDGRTVRGVYVYNDGRWGTVVWQISGDTLKGKWAWPNAGLADGAGGKTWNATRSSTRASALKYANVGREKYPFNDPHFTEGPTQQWIEANSTGTTRPEPSPGDTIRAGLSPLYGAFSLSGIDPVYAIDVNVIHYTGANTAAVDISIRVQPNSICPPIMHQGLCDDLLAASSGQAQNNQLDVTVTGTTIVNLGNIGETIETTFRLSGDRSDRLLRLRREATYFSAFIHHPQRGLDYEGFATGRPHLCEQAQCQNAVFQDIRDHPGKYRTRLDRSAIVRMINLPNAIEASHNSLGLKPNIRAQSEGPVLADGRPWVILDETSENLGQITFSVDGDGVVASGSLRGFFETGEDHDTVFTGTAQTQNSLGFELVTYAGQSGESKTGHLLIEVPTGTRRIPRGTLIVENEVFVIELVKPTKGIDPNEVGDTPAIGVHSVNYALRDVNPSFSVRLRAGPSRSDDVVGTILPTATNLQALTCAPEINSLRFQEASQTDRLSMLSRSWCQVTNGEIAGWLPGIYLTPLSN